jgi:TolB-like protein/Tfp pilus assembly protein PilF
VSEKASFFAELKRRNVYKVAVAYAVVGWLLVQVATQVFPFFEIPNWAVRLVVLLIIVGFPISLVIAWAFEMTPEGIKRTEVADAEHEHSRGKTWIYVVIIGAAISAALFFVGRYTAGNNASATRAELPTKSIAVLPFENLSDDKSNAYFTDGVQDEILTDLARIADLKVISRTSVMQYNETANRNLPEIAQALKVAHVLEGSVQRSANKVRVNAQLIDARTDTHLWAQHFDGDLSDVFAIQSEIAQKIADQLQAVLTPKEKAAIEAKPTSDLTAYDLYLGATQLERGTRSLSRPTLREQVRLLEEATARDPNFLAAFCALARTHLSIYWFNYEDSEASLGEAKKAIDAAERLNADAGEVHLAKAVFYYRGSRDYERALSELRSARRSLPNDSFALELTGLIERRQGHLEQAMRDMEDALKLDPQNASFLNELALGYEGAKRYSDATRVFEEALRWNPNDFVFAVSRAALERNSSANVRPFEVVLTSEIAKKADPDNVARYRMIVALDQRDYASAEKALTDYKLAYFTLLHVAGFNLPREYYQGLIERGLGEDDKAQKAFLAARERAAIDLAKRADNPQRLVVLGLIDAQLGRNEDAAGEGERAAELLPVTKDALDGPEILTLLAEIYAQTGQTDHALDLLERAAPMNFGPQYGDLKLNAMWDPLRHNPRFDAVVESVRTPKS